MYFIAPIYNRNCTTLLRPRPTKVEERNYIPISLFSFVTFWSNYLERSDDHEVYWLPIELLIISHPKLFVFHHFLSFQLLRIHQYTQYLYILRIYFLYNRNLLPRISSKGFKSRRLSVWEASSTRAGATTGALGRICAASSGKKLLSTLLFSIGRGWRIPI